MVLGKIECLWVKEWSQTCTYHPVKEREREKQWERERERKEEKKKLQMDQRPDVNHELPELLQENISSTLQNLDI